MLIVSVALLRAVRNFLTLKLDLTLILVHTKLRKVFSTKMYSNYDLLFYCPLYLFCLSFWDTLPQGGFTAVLVSYFLPVCSD